MNRAGVLLSPRRGGVVVGGTKVVVVGATKVVVV
jgi:hypothetical protein